MSVLQAIGPVHLTEKQFERISQMVKDLCGINLHTGKKELVKARLSRRLRALGMPTLDDYLEYVQQDSSGNELICMLDALSTNLTSFFREPDHFDYLRTVLGPEFMAKTSKRLRLWSAGCSTGEEPYSIAISLLESMPNLASFDTGILATDLSTRVLAKAKAGVYDPSRVSGLPKALLARHFVCTKERQGVTYQVAESVRRLIHFTRLNLMEPWPVHGPFDVIFCRNVMIYFDKPTQAGLVERFWELLGPGGTLLIGHSESLTGVQHRFHYVRPTIYRK
jgi:chemotaxis protein methyltransferase CheR